MYKPHNSLELKMNQSSSFRTAVKLASAAAALSAALMASSSFAANVAPSNQAATMSAAIAQSDANAPQKTRAEVYQELVSAEKSGELAQINKTYVGG
jgi:hypothetical protein